MGQTIIEKIIARNIGASFVKPGDIVTVHADRVMLDDIMIPFIVEKFKEMGFPKIWDPDKVVLIYDHLVPASVIDGSSIKISGKTIPLLQNTELKISTEAMESAIS